MNGKKYIGCSIDIMRRWKEHISYNTGSYIHSAIKKHGKESFDFEIYDKCGDCDFEYYETNLIALYQTMSPNGYNLTSGGKYNIQLSDETRKKLSDSQKGKKFSEESKRRMSESHKGKIHSEESNEKRRNSLLGKKRKPHSEESKRRMSESAKNRVSSFREF